MFSTVNSISKLLWSSASLLAAFFLLRRLFSKDSKLINDLAKVGRRAQDEDVHGPDEYDMIVVGGGTAGCVLASRLSEDPSMRILVLEAGGSGMNLLLSRIPICFPLLFHGKHVYELHTEPQAFANAKTKYWPRGKLLGGCSSINAQMAQYGSPSDFDEWAQTIGDESWSWKQFSRYFRKFEKYTEDPNYISIDTSLRGSKGPIRVGYFSYVSKASKAFIKACMNIGVPFSPDFTTDAGTNGVNRIMTYVDERGERVSAESAYLTKDVLSRPNLKVAIHATVTRILFGKVDGETRAVGVEFTSSQGGPRYRARARKEVIISSGAVHSPQILMLSGVGPAKHLEDLGIPVQHDLPGVGSHLIDHPVVDLYFKDKEGVSIKYVRPHNFSDVFQLLFAAAQYIFNRKGTLTTNFGESAAFIRTDDPVLFPSNMYPSKILDSTSGPSGPDLEIFTTPVAYKEHGVYMFPMHTFALHVCLLRPLSAGSLRLKSSNPWDNPIIDPKYLERQEDVDKLVRGVKLVLKIAQTEPLAPLFDQADVNPGLDHQQHLKSDEGLAQIARDRVESLYHPVATCRMAPLDQGGVVDANLRVYGIQNLRVCDASIFPSLVSGHTAGATLATAEKFADILKAEYSSKF